MLAVAILISGRGSNMRALVEAARGAGYPAQIVGVIANDPQAEGLVYAEKQGLPVRVVDHRAFTDRQAFEAELDRVLKAWGVQLAVLAGFLRLLTPWFVERWLDRLVNIHPSLLPSFPGLHTHRQALDYGVKITGCTVHFVRAAMDHGPVIAQTAVAVHPTDTEETLAARVLAAEHRLYPRVIRWIAEGHVNIHNEKTFITAAESALVSCEESV